MFVAVIRCDFCKKACEVPCRKAGETASIPNGWASIVPMIHIKGQQKIYEMDGKLWNGRTQRFDIEPSKEQKDKIDAKKAFSERTKKLRAQFDKSHVCDDCIEGILTGKVSLKLEQRSGETR